MRVLLSKSQLASPPSLSTMRTLAVDNTGSTARDWCMLERNILSHIKLCLLLSFLSWAILLHARLTSDETESSAGSGSSLPLAIVLMASALISLFSGVWEYILGMRDLENKRAFLVASRCVHMIRTSNTSDAALTPNVDRPHAVVLTIISGIALCTCAILLADGSLVSG